MAFVDLKDFPPKNGLVRWLTENQAPRLEAIVLDEHGDRSMVGMADPTDLKVVNGIVLLLNRQIGIVIVKEGQRLEAIDRGYAGPFMHQTASRVGCGPVNGFTFPCLTSNFPGEHE